MGMDEPDKRVKNTHINLRLLNSYVIDSTDTANIYPLYDFVYI